MAHESIEDPAVLASAHVKLFDGEQACASPFESQRKDKRRQRLNGFRMVSACSIT
jgi:hypothetical protein